MGVFFGGANEPGFTAASETTERMARLGPDDWMLLKGIKLKSTASDAGNTPTTDLRHGLLLGQLTADGLYEHYQPNVATGAQLCQGYLWEPRRMIDGDGTAVAQVAQMVISGYVDASVLLLLDHQARAQLHGRFIFDDDLVGNGCGWKQVLAKTDNYTVLAADNNTIFTNQGASAAVTFTLPTLAKGLRYRFFAEAAQNVHVVSATSDNLVVFNDAAADSINMNTSNEIVGAAVEVFANADGTKWLIFEMVHDGQTLVVAT